MDIIQAERWAVEQMAHWGLINEGWTFDFDGSRQTIGLCNYTTKRITVSLHYTKLNSEFLFKDTVLHEIAHALAGHKAGHGPLWKAKCILVGAQPTRLADSRTIKSPTKKYVALCSSCGHLHQFSRLPMKRKACGICDPKYNPNYLLTIVLNSEYKK